MKHLNFVIRLILAAVFLLSSGLLPHHHHHGEPCWAMNDKAKHHNKEHKCPTEPCHDTACFLQMVKDLGNHNTSSDVLPTPYHALSGESDLLSPIWQWLQPSLRKGFQGILLHSDFSAFQLRGPPTI